MPRKRKYRDNAERQAAYRTRNREIIAIDGEGYTAYGEHVYASLFAYDGKELHEIHAIDYGLSLTKILRFIRDIAVQKPNAIWISFSFSYDVTMMFRTLTAEEIDKMLHGGVYLSDYGVYVAYRYRKQLRIVFNKTLSVTIYDLFGFTSSSFVKTMQIFGVNEGLDTVQEGKALRGDLEAYDRDRIREYTRAELQALIMVFQKILHYAENAGLSLTRYEGAGSVASALFRAYGYSGKVAKTMAIKADNEDKDIVLDRLYRAYYGGRIETHKYGYVRTVYGYDIVSAYPAVTQRLPDLRKGIFRYKTNPDRRFITEVINTHDYGVITLRYNLPDNYFYPFPYRDRTAVYYPQIGYSSVYLPLFRVALEHIPRLWDYIDIEDIVWLECERYDDFPFVWINEVFQRRNELKAAGNPAQLMLKLGLNSIYGKFAQKPIIEKDRVVNGTYENVFYAGYITASTQAALLQAAYQKPETIIAMATDGIYSTEPLVLDIGKGLGQWEYEAWEEGIFVYSGFYILRNGGKIKYRARGLHIKQPEVVFQQILQEWKQGAREACIPMTIFHSIKRKKKDDDYVGYFEQIEKVIDLTGGKGKRVSLYNAQPHNELCETLAVGYDYFYDILADKARAAQYEDNSEEIEGE